MDATHLWHILQTELENIKNEVKKEHHSVLEKSFDSMKMAIQEYLNEQVITGLPHPHPRSRIYRSEPKNWQIKDASSNQLLEMILQKASKSKAHKPACVFDLDGTLFDVGYRTLGIIQEWLNSPAAASYNKNLFKKVEKITYQHIGYGISHAFENAGFDLHDQDVMEVYTAVERHWKKCFFDGESLLKYDVLMENSNDFIHTLNKNGVEIFYLTGRHYHNMFAGTVKQLGKYGFPFKQENLILKQFAHADDQIFKAEAIKKIAENFEVVGNFENEYLNLGCMSLEVPNSVHVIVDSQHSGRPVPEMEWPAYRISKFEPVNP